MRAALSQTENSPDDLALCEREEQAPPLPINSFIIHHSSFIIYKPVGACIARPRVVVGADPYQQER